MTLKSISVQLMAILTKQLPISRNAAPYDITRNLMNFAFNTEALIVMAWFEKMDISDYYLKITTWDGKQHTSALEHIEFVFDGVFEQTTTPQAATSITMDIDDHDVQTFNIKDIKYICLSNTP